MAKVKLFRVFSDFLHRYFSDEEAVILFFLIIIFFAMLYWLGSILTPLLAAVILSYLLSPLVDRLVRFKIPQLFAVFLVFLVFFGVLMVSMLVLIPQLVKQVSALVADMPRMMRLFQQELASLPERYPELLSQEVVTQWVNSLDLLAVGQQLSAWLPNVLSFLVY